MIQYAILGLLSWKPLSGYDLKKIISNTETVRLAERSYDLAAISFKNGVINQIDVIDAGTQLSNARLGYYSAVLEYLTARTELEELLEKK